mgnify:CR=1 FL=1
MIYRLHDKQITETTLEKQHKEVIAIQKSYYGSLLETMNSEQEEFYIRGIYFRENKEELARTKIELIDTQGFLAQEKECSQALRKERTKLRKMVTKLGGDWREPKND